VPKLPTNMIRRKGRPGYWFRGKLEGKLCQRSLGTDYKNACVELERLRSLKTRERSFGVEGLPSNATVSVAAFAWLRHYVPGTRNEKGQRLAEAWVKQHLIPFLGAYVLARLNSDHLQAYRLELEQTPARRRKGDDGKEKMLSPQTVANIMSDVRCLLLWCKDRGYIERSPFRQRLMPSIQERPPDRVSDEDAELLKAMPDPHGFVARLALGTGLRWGELCRAQASDVQRGFLVVHKTKSTKLRRVPLEPELLAEIRNRVGLLVPFSEKSPGSFAKAAKSLTGMERFHVHQLRHTFACQWLEKGRSLHALQQVLGHQSVETTQRYGRLSDDAVMSELQKGSCR